VTHPFRKTSTTMADGRELIYFDDTEPWLSGERVRDAVDHRPLRPADETQRGGSQVRFDPLTGDWIAMASHRNDRTLMPPPDQDPLAPTAPGGFPTEIADSSYDVVAFENRFPSFSNRIGGEEGLLDGERLWPTRPAAGRCEVVCFSSDTHGSFGTLDPRRARTVLEAWIDRTETLNATDGVEQVFVFENRGEEIGVTLPHPHGQIYGYPFLTPKTETMLRRAREHRAAGGGNLFRDVLDAERRAGSRVVFETEHFTAYLDLLGRLDRYYPDDHPLPYIAGWHQAPAREGRDEFRLHLQVFSVLRGPSKVKFLAGSESAMAAWVNDTTPEKVAARLREVAP
jgi:UDPglucose--hexose-1-phosphate uridylyltransferase